jgi:uncharacterized protein YggE
MKLSYLAAAGLALLALTALPAAAATQDQRTIVVVAAGSVGIDGPAQWTLGVEVKDDSARVAMRTSAATIARVRSALLRAGVPAGHLVVSSTVGPDEQEAPGAFDAFVAERTISLTIAGPQRAALLIDKATTAGANYVSGPELSDAQQGDLNNQAIDAALDAARTKAQAVARKTGVTLGPVLAVEEGIGYDGFDRYSGKFYATVAVEFAVF